MGTETEDMEVTTMNSKNSIPAELSLHHQQLPVSSLYQVPHRINGTVFLPPR